MVATEEEISEDDDGQLLLQKELVLPNVGAEAEAEAVAQVMLLPSVVLEVVVVVAVEVVVEEADAAAEAEDEGEDFITKAVVVVVWLRSCNGGQSRAVDFDSIRAQLIYAGFLEFQFISQWNIQANCNCIDLSMVDTDE